MNCSSADIALAIARDLIWLCLRFRLFRSFHNENSFRFDYISLQTTNCKGSWSHWTLLYLVHPHVRRRCIAILTFVVSRRKHFICRSGVWVHLHWNVEITSAYRKCKSTWICTRTECCRLMFAIRLIENVPLNFAIKNGQIEVTSIAKWILNNFVCPNLLCTLQTKNVHRLARSLDRMAIQSLDHQSNFTAT